MVAYSFQPRFVGPIIAGTKRQTIRAKRKRHVRPGETMQLYMGLRTKQWELIGTAMCRRILPIMVNLRDACIECDGHLRTSADDLRVFANADGFPSGWVEMRDFWREHYPDAGDVWRGVLIVWRDFRQADAPITA